MRISRKNIISFSFILLLSIIITLSAFWHGTFSLTYDGKIYLGRIQQIYESLKEFQLPPMINFIGQDHNLGAMTAMYPWLSSLIFVIPLFIFKNGFYAFFVGFVILNFITGSNFYFLARYLSKNKLYVYLGTIIYLFNSYHLEEMFVRNAIGEALAYAFFPLVALGLLQIWSQNKHGVYNLSLGMIGIANSHILSLYFVILIILISELFRLISKKISMIEIENFMKAIVFTILGSIYMIYQFCDTLFKNKGMTMASRFFNYVSPSISFNEMINNHLKVLYNSWHIGLICCLLLLFFLMESFSKEKVEAWIIATWIAVVSLLFSFGLFHVPSKFFFTFQFAGRIYCLTVFCISLAAVIYFNKYSTSSLSSIMISLLIILMGCSSILSYKLSPSITDQAEVTSNFNKNNYYSMYSTSGCSDYTLKRVNPKDYKESAVTWKKSTGNSATYKVQNKGENLLPISAFKNVEYDMYINRKKVKVNKVQNRFLISTAKKNSTVKIVSRTGILSYLTFIISVVIIFAISIWDINMKHYMNIGAEK